MDRLDSLAFLDEPMRMAQVAAVSPSENPLLGSLWFEFAEGRFWFSSHPTSPLVLAARRSAPVAVIVDQFDPPDKIRQVRVRGQSQIEPHDVARVQAIYARYLGTDQEQWGSFAERALDPSWNLWSVDTRSGVTTAFPDFNPTEVRWRDLEHSPLA